MPLERWSQSKGHEAILGIPKAVRSSAATLKEATGTAASAGGRAAEGGAGVKGEGAAAAAAAVCRYARDGFRIADSYMIGFRNS
jgi:hypothetical protein